MKHLAPIVTVLLCTVACATAPAAKPCGAAQMRTEFVHGPAGVEQRVIDRRRCGVVELRVIDHYDASTSTRTREILRDLDHDGQFERYWMNVEPLVAARGRAPVGVDPAGSRARPVLDP